MLVVANSVFTIHLLSLPAMSLQSQLDHYYELYNRSDFIEHDPILLPHRFTKKEDIEIIAFFVALIAWGQRISIIRSGEKLIQLFHNAPHDFILHHTDKDLKACQSFVHRTFNGDDLLSLIAYLKALYQSGEGLEKAFSKHLKRTDTTVEAALIGFRRAFQNSEVALSRTLKHIATPEKGSACKRLNMYLRWMVRKDDKGVDFGIWKSIKASQLVCPLDVHVIRQAGELGLISNSKGDWKTALELTQNLKVFDPKDPVKYDFALFGKGVSESL